MIGNSTSKVYGPSIKNFYEAEAVLGLMNFMTFGFKGFFERHKELTIEITGDLES